MEARRRPVDARPRMTGAPSGRLAAWARHAVPTRESIERNRWLRPVSSRVLAPSLWRFNRRSVPRAAAVGAMCTVLFPFAHMPIAALASVPARANVPIAVAMTVPGTFVFGPIWFAAFRIGRWMLRLDREVPGHPIATGVEKHGGVLHWLAHGGPATITGLLVLAPLLSAAAYALAALAWRWRVGRKWRARSVVRASAR